MKIRPLWGHDRNKRAWQRWFAWRPVRFNYWVSEWVWFEFVERKGSYCEMPDGRGWRWKYRPVERVTEKEQNLAMIYPIARRRGRA